MRLLLNMNLPRKLGERLERQGHICRHVADIGMAQADDREIVSEARKTGEVILTHDLDYGNLLVFSGSARPSAVIIRMSDISIDRLEHALAAAWSKIENPLIDGAVVVLTESGIRIRRLSEPAE